MGDVISFAGEEFHVAERIGLMPLMRFAHLASAGVDSEDMEALAAMYDLLEQCVANGEWQRFQRAATRTRADGEALMKVVQDAIAVLSERPTGRPSDSSDGPTTTRPKSAIGQVSSESRDDYLAVVKEWEDKGRPDTALMVLMAGEAREREAARSAS